MRNGYKVYDSDTHIRPGADTLEKYLSARIRELVPDLESRKVPLRRHSTGFAYTPPYPRSFRLSAATPSAAGEQTSRACWARRSRAPPRAGPMADSWGRSIQACTATTGTWTDASATWTKRALTSSCSSILADRVGTRTVTSISSSCGHNIAIWTTSVANTRTDSSR